MTLPGPFVRLARPGDAAAFARILRDDGVAYVLAEAPEATRVRVREGVRFYAESESHAAWVAETPQGRVGGFVAVAWTRTLRFGVDGYLLELFVHSRWRGKGLGSRLLERVEIEAAKRGCGRLLHHPQGEAACRLAFYVRNGWHEQQGGALLVLEVTPEERGGEQLAPTAAG